MIPEPLTSLQKRTFIVLAFAIAMTRIAAIARSLFDWDEAQFCSAVRSYDVALHHPHPPGYPLFIAAAKLVHALGVAEFRSLQVIVVIGAMLIFPALLFLAREIGFSFTTSVAAALIFSFLPNVWIYGGTAFSDVPATAICFAACALLLRGRHDRRAYLLGAVLLGIAAGFRPPNLLIGALPAILATRAQVRARAWGTIAAAVLAGGAIAGGSYLGAALASRSLADFAEALSIQSRWVREVDSYRSPTRPPLAQVARLFFLWPAGPRSLMLVLPCLAVISLAAASVKRRVEPLLAFAIFAPFAITAWLTLDISAAGRYSISFLAAHALLAADGLRVVGRRSGVQGSVAAALVLAFAIWTWPAVETQRRTDAPPAAALGWIARSVPTDAPVFVHGAYRPHAAFLLPHHQKAFFESTEEIPMMSGNGWVVDYQIRPDGMNFVRPRNALWQILRPRAFEASIGRVSGLVRPGEGWFAQEGNDDAVWRWMGRESQTKLPSFAGNGRLLLSFFVPLDSLSRSPVVTIELNGEVVERFEAKTEEVRKAWVLASRRDAPNDLRITTSETVIPRQAGTADDPRSLGLRFDLIQWSPAR